MKYSRRISQWCSPTERKMKTARIRKIVNSEQLKKNCWSFCGLVTRQKQFLLLHFFFFLESISRASIHDFVRTALETGLLEIVRKPSTENEDYHIVRSGTTRNSQSLSHPSFRLHTETTDSRNTHSQWYLTRIEKFSSTVLFSNPRGH